MFFFICLITSQINFGVGENCLNLCIEIVSETIVRATLASSWMNLKCFCCNLYICRNQAAHLFVSAVFINTTLITWGIYIVALFVFKLDGTGVFWTYKSDLMLEIERMKYTVLLYTFEKRINFKLAQHSNIFTTKSLTSSKPRCRSIWRPRLRNRLGRVWTALWQTWNQIDQDLHKHFVWLSM